MSPGEQTLVLDRTASHGYATTWDLSAAERQALCSLGAGAQLHVQLVELQEAALPDEEKMSSLCPTPCTGLPGRHFTARAVYESTQWSGGLSVEDFATLLTPVVSRLSRAHERKGTVYPLRCVAVGMSPRAVRGGDCLYGKFTVYFAVARRGLLIDSLFHLSGGTKPAHLRRRIMHCSRLVGFWKEAWQEAVAVQSGRSVLFSVLKGADARIAASRAVHGASVPSAVTESDIQSCLLVELAKGDVP